VKKSERGHFFIGILGPALIRGLRKVKKKTDMIPTFKSHVQMAVVNNVRYERKEGRITSQSHCRYEKLPLISGINMMPGREWNKSLLQGEERFVIKDGNRVLAVIRVAAGPGIAAENLSMDGLSPKTRTLFITLSI